MSFKFLILNYCLQTFQFQKFVNDKISYQIKLKLRHNVDLLMINDLEFDNRKIQNRQNE